ncbi:TPA: glycosyltransferase family 2 protein [Escherichia coli]|uniref:glycosyltransferase family 2 protein n=1 Tax=Escherichia coli TaxID=562 RepID=UPI0017609D45|nr:glycosyltransferase family 2 protein [Escherichia coli]MCH4762983.1 glycosyltransferase family 2 protein [Escherichia coli]MCH6353814.1 glycosyltransferase family 2 protein [Escherichia coli]HAJ6654365.1 glycosyltransferase family 2 protein [Escherichia coli]
MHLVSIIMPTYNSSSTIHQSIESVISQTYTNWELLITDDCSSDDTYKIICNYALKDHRIRVFQNNINSGAGLTRNNSIEHARGRFIAFLDSDDMWTNDKLEKQIKFMLDNHFPLTYTYYKKTNASGEITGRLRPPLEVNYNELLKSNVIGCLTAIYDASSLGKVYMPTIRKRQDMGLWLNILKIVPTAHCLAEELAIYREGHESLSSNKLKILRTQWLFYREHVGLSFIKTLWYFSHYVIRALKKYKLPS